MQERPLQQQQKMQHERRVRPPTTEGTMMATSIQGGMFCVGGKRMTRGGELPPAVIVVVRGVEP